MNKCLVCHKELHPIFMGQRRWRTNSKFCSYICSGLYRAKHMKDFGNFIGHHHTKETKGKIALASKGRKWTDEQKKELRKTFNIEARRKGGVNAIRKLRLRKITDIEKIVYDELKRMGITFEAQYNINDRFVVDVYIPSNKTVIEIDGEYWHNLDRIKKKDYAESCYLRKCGYNLIRIPGHNVFSGTYKEVLMNIVSKYIN